MEEHMAISKAKAPDLTSRSNKILKPVIPFEGGLKMLPFKRILCPTDFSEPSYEALKIANELALYFSSDLFVLHVVPPIPTANVSPPPADKAPAKGFNISSYRHQLEELSKTSLKKVVAQRIAKKIKVHPIVVQGEASDQIIDTVDRQKIDLIVIATHGRTGWRRVIFGSVAEKVIRLAPCPVLTIQPPHEG
jgi:nucleotide-binding universal stress UspA family protein